MPRLRTALLLLGLLVAAAAERTARATPAVTFSPAKGIVLPLRTHEEGGRLLFSVNDVAAALDLKLEADTRTRSFELKQKERSAVFGADASVAVVETRIVKLAAPLVVDAALVYGDKEFLDKVVAPLTGLGFVWDAATRTLVARTVEVADVRVEVSVQNFADASKVVLRLSHPPAFKPERGESQLVLRFPGSRLVPAAPERTLDDPFVSRVLLRGDEAAVVLRDPALQTHVYALGGPPRIVVDVTRPVAASSSARLPGAGAPGAGPAAMPSQGRLEGPVVVLDPGHGGPEEGAKGPAGLLEKDATLALVKALKDVLTARGYRVHTTRETDMDVSLEDRAASANAAKAEAFVSIHLNASRSPVAHGTEVYYLSLDASDRAAAALAESENLRGTLSASPAGPGAPAPEAAPAAPTPFATPPPVDAETNAALRELDLILWDLAQNQHLAESARLAEIVQADFNRLLGIPSRGVKQAPFRVLIGVNAPAVLVEVAFVSNPAEEAKLHTEEFRKASAETIALSLDTFFKRGRPATPLLGTAPSTPAPAPRPAGSR